MGQLGTEAGIKSPGQLGIMNKKDPYNSGYQFDF